MVLKQMLEDVINFTEAPIDEAKFTEECRNELEQKGVVTLHNFLKPETVKELVREAKSHSNLAYFTNSTHNVYLTPTNKALSPDHVFNRQLTSSKGCITTDQIPNASKLKRLYFSDIFKKFICKVVEETDLYEYADPLSSINVHYAAKGQELNWHFDNSKFAITLLLQAPKSGGHFEYVSNLRNAEKNEMNFEGVEAVLEGKTKINRLDTRPGTLILFRGQNSIHRVTPTEGEQERILVVLAYNSQPGISLSEEARMTFFGRLQ